MKKNCSEVNAGKQFNSLKISKDGHFPKGSVKYGSN